MVSGAFGTHPIRSRAEDDMTAISFTGFNVSGELEDCDSFYLRQKTHRFTLLQRGWPALWMSLEHEATCFVLPSLLHGYG